jgi:hypothetical protein
VAGIGGGLVTAGIVIFALRRTTPVRE